MFNNLPRPTLFAHRGSSMVAPENTLAAFELAVRQGADAIELDAKLSKDGAVMVIHDQTVERTTGAKGRVRQLTLAELRELDAGSFFDASFKGEKIPTLDEVFEAVGKKTYINVELTNYASPTDSLPEKVAEMVLAHGLVGRVFFSSFNPLALIRARGRLPLVPGGLLCIAGQPGAWARGWAGRMAGYQALHPEREISPRRWSRTATGAASGCTSTP